MFFVSEITCDAWFVAGTTGKGKVVVRRDKDNKFLGYTFKKAKADDSGAVDKIVEKVVASGAKAGAIDAVRF